MKTEQIRSSLARAADHLEIAGRLAATMTRREPDPEIEATRAAAAAAIQDLEITAGELARQLEQGDTTWPRSVARLGDDMETVRRAIAELARVSR